MNSPQLAAFMTPTDADSSGLLAVSEVGSSIYDSQMSTSPLLSLPSLAPQTEVQRQEFELNQTKRDLRDTQNKLDRTELARQALELKVKGLNAELERKNQAILQCKAQLHYAQLHSQFQNPSPMPKSPRSLMQKVATKTHDFLETFSLTSSCSPSTLSLPSGPKTHRRSKSSTSSITITTTVAAPVNEDVEPPTTNINRDFLQPFDLFTPRDVDVVVPIKGIVPCPEFATSMTVAKAIVPYLALPSGTLRHSKSQDTLVNETPDDTSEERFVKMTMDVQPDIHGDRGRLAQYNLNGLLGSGATGRVLKGQNRETKLHYAVKEISTENIIMKRAPGTFFKLVMLGSGKRAPEAQKVVVDGKPMNMIRKEIAILKKLRHAHTVKLHEVLECNDAKTVYLVFELCKGEVVLKGKKLSEHECKNAFRQMLYGVEYLHAHNIIHRDIKPANILQGADGNIKIADFGLSVMFKEDESSADREWAGSRAFMAPEHARDRTSPFTKATDIWAMGVTLYMMYTGRPPFKEQYCRPLTQVIREDDFPPVGNTRLEALLKKLLHKDPSKRHTMDQLRHDTWVTDCYSHRLITKAENIEHAVRDISELEIERAIKQAKLAVVVKKCVDTLSSYMRSPRQPISAKMILAYMNQRNSPTSPEELEDSSLQSVSVETEPAEAVSSSSTSAPAGVFRINTAVASSGAAIGMSPLSPSAPVAILVAPATPTSPIADLDKDPRAQQFHRTFIPVNDETAEYIPAFNGLYRTGTFPKGFEPETFSSEAMKPKEVAALVQWNTFLEERKGEQN